jgi:TRAP-type mannitol/chloroaromatic compound transport system permease small subunit
LLALPLLLVVVYEVVMRYAFNAPTTWGFEATDLSSTGCTTCWGWPSCDVYGGHVRVDIFTSRMNLRAAGCHRCFDQSGLFHAGDDPDDHRILEIRPDIHRRQRELNPTSWAPPIYPIKTLMAISFSFLLIQGISNLIHNIRVLQGKAEGVR